MGVASGSFVAPDHEYPSHLLLSVTARDAAGLTSTQTVRLDPRTANVTLASVPTGLTLSFGSDTTSAPFTRTVIARSANSISAPSRQTLGAFTYAFALVERRSRRDALDHGARWRRHGDLHRHLRRASP